MTRCPDCGFVVDTHSQVGRPGEIRGGGPREGDLAVCIECGYIGVFHPGPFGVTIHRPTDKQQEQIEADHTVMMVSGLIRRARMLR